MGEIKKANLRVTALYFDEDGAFDEDIYIVWLNGATDGWPQAMFRNLRCAEEWVKTIYLNPEGYIIEKANFMELCHKISEMGKAGEFGET